MIKRVTKGDSRGSWQRWGILGALGYVVESAMYFPVLVNKGTFALALAVLVVTKLVVVFVQKYLDL